MEMIYQKKYPKVTLKKLMAECEKIDMESDVSMPSFDEFMKKISKETCYVLMPEKQKQADRFIQEAIAFAELHTTDVEITKDLSYINVRLFIDGGGVFQGFRRLMSMADQFSVFESNREYDFVIDISYYTHALFRNGRQIYPDILCD